MAIYQSHTGAPDYQAIAARYKPFDLAGAVEEGMKFALDMTNAQVNTVRNMQQMELENQLAPLKIAEARTTMEMLDRKNKIDAVVNTAERAKKHAEYLDKEEQFNLKKAEFETKRLEHQSQLLALEEDGAFGSLQDLAMNNPARYFEARDQFTSSSPMGKNPLVVGRLTELDRTARENLNSGNFSPTLSQDDIDRNTNMVRDIMKKQKMSAMRRAGMSDQSIARYLKEENDTVDRIAKADILGMEISKMEREKTGKAPPPEMSVLPGWDTTVGTGLLFQGDVNFYELSRNVLSKVRDNLVKTRGMVEDKSVVNEKIHRIDNMMRSINNWGGAFFADETDRKTMDSYREQYNSAKTPEEKKSAKLAFANWLGDFSLNYDLDVMKERQRRLLGPSMSGVQLPSGATGGIEAGAMVQSGNPEQKKQAIRAANPGKTDAQLAPLFSKYGLQ